MEPKGSSDRNGGPGPHFGTIENGEHGHPTWLHEARFFFEGAGMSPHEPLFS